MEKVREKLHSRSGIAVVFLLLITAIGVVCISIAIYGFQQHLKDSRRMFDEAQVDTAKRVARETYILDLVEGGVTYYYDEMKHNVVNAANFEGKVDVKGYGRSYEDENLNGETGADGIPNKGKDGGAQFIAVSVEENGTTHARWQGPYLTGYDYELMTPGERSRLTKEQIDQIGMDLVYAHLGESEASPPAETEDESETETETGS